MDQNDQLLKRFDRKNDVFFFFFAPPPFFLRMLYWRVTLESVWQKPKLVPPEAAQSAFSKFEFLQRKAARLMSKKDSWYVGITGDYSFL